MKKSFFHFITFSAVFILTWIVTPTPAHALCDVTSAANRTIPCNVNGVQYYCDTNPACQTLKGNTSGTTNAGAASQGFKPEECDGNTGIQTALGCLHYKSEGGAFTRDLFTLLAGIAGAISLVIMLIATIQIMTGGDNAEQVKKGKELFTGAITGLLFIIFSVTLLKLVAGDIIKLPGFN